MAITEKIIIEVDGNQAVSGYTGIQKAISKLKLELSKLDEGTAEYTDTFNKLSGLMKIQNDRMLQLRKSSSESGLRGDIKKLKLELDGLTEGTVEYDRVSMELSSKMKIQADRMEFLRASSADFGDVIQNTSKSLAGFVGAFSGINAAIGLFSDNNQELQEQMLKVQQLMAIVQGFSALDEGSKAFERLISNVKGYMRSMKQSSDAIVATGKAATLSETQLAGATNTTAAAQMTKGTNAIEANADIVKSDNEATLVQLQNIKELKIAEANRAKELKTNADAEFAKAKKMAQSDKIFDTEKYNDYINKTKALDDEAKIVNNHINDLDTQITTLEGNLNKTTKATGSMFSKLKKSVVSFSKTIMTSIGIFALLSVAIWGVTKIIDYFKNKAKEAGRAMEEWIEYNTAFAQSVSTTASKSITSFMVLKKGWDALNNDINKQNLYLKENRKIFDELFGNKKRTIKEYGELFAKHSKEIINGYIAQAKAASYLELLQKNITRGIELDLTPISYKKGMVLGTEMENKTQANLKKAKEERAKERAKLKKEQESLLAGLSKYEEEYNAISAKLSFDDVKADKTPPQNTQIKQFSDLETVYVAFLSKIKEVIKNTYKEQMTLNEEYLFETKKINTKNFDEIYNQTATYYKRLNELNLAKINEDKKVADTEALLIKENTLKEIEASIKGIQENAKLRNGKINKEENKLIEDYNKQKLVIIDNYNKTIENNIIDQNENIRILNETNYNNELNNLINYYNNKTELLANNLEKEIGIFNTFYNTKKQQFIKDQDVSLLQLMFGGDNTSYKTSMLEFDKELNILQKRLIEAIEREKILKEKSLNEGLSAEERTKAEIEYNKVVEYMSQIRIDIAQNESDKLKAINEETILHLQNSIGGLSEFVINVGNINDDNLQRITNNLDAQFNDNSIVLQNKLNKNLIDKQQYDAELIDLENKYNEEVYKTQLYHNEKNKKIQIFQTIIETLTSAQKSYSSLANVPVVGPVLGSIAAAGALASGYARVRMIQSQQIDKPSVGVLSNDTTNASLNTNLIYQSANLQAGNNQILNSVENKKIYVSVTDINEVQNKVKVVDNNSTF